MIRFQDLSVAFDGFKALDDLSFQLDAPTCGLIGPNGAGKTTLVDAICGFVPVSGQIFMDEIDLARMDSISRVQAGLRRSFQHEMIVEDLSVWANVLAVMDHLQPRTQAYRDVGTALEFVGLLKQAKRLGGDLDLFERRMLELAKTLVGGPKLILLDEPGAGLDEFEAEQLRNAIRDMPTIFGAQVLLIDHDVELILAVCSQTMVLEFGKRLAVGHTADVLQHPEVRRAYLGQRVARKNHVGN